ncbi:hypothetical protein F443_01500 [Phytophthora nicotianae P1569]|uniref:Uncharacterized protein n=1 Tax=Phytophthora nicotianae P1569 TaxID=1317065 RepID=V9FWL1_PHYNI|nr:hypothetical protein F443_01500 [Phytophthora nicotianae P1569]
MAIVSSFAFNSRRSIITSLDIAALQRKSDANRIGVERVSTPSSSLIDDVKAAYASDADAKELLDYVSAASEEESRKLAPHLRARAHRYRVHEGLLLYSAVDDDADRIHENNQTMKKITKKTRKIVEIVKKEKLEVQYASSEGNIADIFTKALGPTRFQGLRKALNVEDVTAVQVHTERGGSNRSCNKQQYDARCTADFVTQLEPGDMRDKTIYVPCVGMRSLKGFFVVEGALHVQRSFLLVYDTYSTMNTQEKGNNSILVFAQY